MLYFVITYSSSLTLFGVDILSLHGYHFMVIFLINHERVRLNVIFNGKLTILFTHVYYQIVNFSVTHVIMCVSVYIIYVYHFQIALFSLNSVDVNIIDFLEDNGCFSGYFSINGESENAWG